VGLLLAEVLGVDRHALALEPERVLTPEEAATFEALLARREAREPVAYLLGRREFYGIDLVVGPGALVPRPDTETLVELALERLPGEGNGRRVLDVGTGSGAIAAVLREYRPRARVLASDRSPEALAVADRNLAPRGVRVVRGDWVDWVGPGALDVLVSNPPYLDPASRDRLAPDLAFEPTDALFAPEAGLACIERLCREAPRVLRPGGWILLEHGWDQGPAARDLAQAAGLAEVGTVSDLAGRDRCLVARRRG
jgi:release factor glutamine methyltransferase